MNIGNAKRGRHENGYINKYFNDEIIKCWKMEIGTCENIMSKEK